eukprot:TRINITY_DN6197_c0_g6_i1.p1 TRINITY_DN6197_c0_g6~~TRINITY_DN6197_c0_g6_i1.p1  ORF type:complete len:179 (-),score=7.33 TRINITY_DN6197_c0_g6_i1:403-939(-)
MNVKCLFYNFNCVKYTSFHTSFWGIPQHTFFQQNSTYLLCRCNTSNNSIILNLLFNQKFVFYIQPIPVSIGGGFNEFNKQKNIIRIFRWGFPGKNRKIDLMYALKDVEAIRVEFIEGLNPKRTIYLTLKGQKEIPLTRIGQPLSLEEIETQAAEIAKFLKIDLILNQNLINQKNKHCS